MYSENVELVRSIFAAWERGEPPAPLGRADPEIELVMVGGPEPGTWSGLVEVESFLRQYLSAWEEYHVEAGDYRELDDERVLVPTHAGGRGKASGLDVTATRGCHLLHLRKGKVTRWVFYWDRELAFADLGLAPEGDSP